MQKTPKRLLDKKSIFRTLSAWWASVFFCYLFLATTGGCKDDACKDESTAFQMDILLAAGIDGKKIDSITVTVDGAGYHKQSNLTGMSSQLTDGQTSFVVKMETVNAGFIATIEVAAKDAEGQIIASGQGSYSINADACNFFNLKLNSKVGDGGPTSDGPISKDGGPDGAPDPCRWNTKTPAILSSSYYLEDSWVSKTGQIFIVGYRSNIYPNEGVILHFNGAEWKETLIKGSTNSDNRHLYSVWGVSDTDVYAGGYQGRIYHYDGKGWTMEKLSSSVSLMGLWGSSWNNIFAVTSSNIVFHFDGKHWGRYNMGISISSGLKAVWGTGPRDIYIVGSEAILYYNGTEWKNLYTALTSGYYYLYDVWGSSSTDVYVVGYHSTTGTNIVLHSSGKGNSFSGQSLPTASSDRSYLYGVWGTGPKDIYAVGRKYDTKASRYVPLVFHYKESSWTEEDHDIQQTSYLVGACGLGPKRVYIYGKYGMILRYDGNKISNATTTAPMNGIWAIKESEIWAVGDSGLVSYFDGTNWASIPMKSAATSNNLNAIWGNPTGDLYVAGDGGLVLEYDHSNKVWARLDISIVPKPTENLRGVWGEGDNVYFVGDNATFLTLKKGKTPKDNIWQMPTVNQAFDLFGVWGEGTLIFAVGSGGNIWRGKNGASWTKDISGTTESLLAVWGTGKGDAVRVFAVGLHGTIVRYDGKQWSVMPSGVMIDLFAVWGTSTSDVYAAGRNGGILHYDGKTWTKMSSGTTSGLYAIGGAGESSSAVHIVGDAVLYRSCK